MKPLYLYPITSILCFALAILFFRKDNTSLNRVFLPFITSLYSPAKMKEHLKIEGIWLIIMGYVSFIVYLIIS